MGKTQSHDADVAAPPRENLVRALRPGLEIRSDEGEMPTLYGHFAIFNRWTEIDSWFEGHFMERIAPGAFRKTIAENRDQVKVTFQHGHDPQLGDKPLGPLEDLREDRKGGYYEVAMLDTAYNRELIPGLEAGLYGASFRFEVLQEHFDREPEASADNPQAIPERTLKEIRLFEVGPVTWPAYAEADAQLRSLTDRFTFDVIERNPERFRELLGVERTRVTVEPEPVAATTPDPPKPEPVAATTSPAIRPKPITREEFIQWNS